jgi:plastocyanin
MKKIIVISGVLAILALVGIVHIHNSGPAIEQVQPTGNVTEVHMTEEGFEPSDITIAPGDTIRWVNDGKDWHWPASNLHPTHLLYPEFDPLKPVAAGASWDFVFEKAGDWKFHDHLHPDKGGVVHVVARN